MLSERTLWRALTCALEYRQTRKRSGQLGRTDWIDQTIRELEQEIPEVSRERQTGTGDRPASKHEDRTLTSAQVANMIGWHIKKVQRRYEELGGEKAGRVLVFRESIIREHIEGCAA